MVFGLLINKKSVFENVLFLWDLKYFVLIFVGVVLNDMLNLLF